MGCFIGCLALGAPRLALILVVIFSDYIGRAYETNVWPVIGFFLMPTTTLAYAWAINTNHSVSGIYLVAVVLAVMIDLGLVGAGARARRE